MNKVDAQNVSSLGQGGPWVVQRWHSRPTSIGPNATMSYMNIDLDVLDIYEHRPGVQFDSMKEISDVEALDL